MIAPPPYRGPRYVPDMWNSVAMIDFIVRGRQSTRVTLRELHKFETELASNEQWNVDRLELHRNRPWLSRMKDWWYYGSSF